MRAAEARQAIGAAVSDQVRAMFEYQAQDNRQRTAKAGDSGSAVHRDRVQVPEVPVTVVETRQVVTDPKVIFTWKVRHDAHPIFIMYVPSYWTRRIVAQGWALLDGFPVLDVLDWDESGQPRRVHTVDFSGYWDGRWGWRATAADTVRLVDWSEPDAPKLTVP
jgi:hypothetical protein